MKLIFYIFLLSFSTNLIGQLEIRDSLVFTNTDSTLRQFEGVSYPTKSSNATNQSSVVSGLIKYSVATGVNFLSADLYPIITSYKKGMVVNLLITNFNTDSVYVNLNNLGNIPVYKNVNQPLKEGELISGSILEIIYDGTNFQVISGLSVIGKQCPNGFADINNSYCIEVNENSDTTMWAAMNDCGNKGARLCKWQEWYIACINSSSFGINDMTNNYEWVDDAGNYTNNGKGLGYHPGFGYTCNASNTLPPNNSNLLGVGINYRCCYSKK